MNILVFGGTGFVGPALVRSLHAQGHTVTVLNRQRTDCPLPEGVRRRIGDRYDAASLAAALDHAEERWDVVFDLIAFNGACVDRALPLLAGRVDHWVAISSAAVYAWPLGATIREDDPLGSDDPYAAGKIELERRLATMAELIGLPWTIVRPAVLYGPRDNDGRRGLHLFHRILTGMPVVLPGSLETRVNYLHVDDLADLLTRLPGNPTSHGRIYNAASPCPFTLRQLIAAHATAAGCPVTARALRLSWDEFTADPRWQRPEFLYFSFVDHVFSPERAQDELGWHPERTLVDGLRSTWAWVRQAFPDLAATPPTDAQAEAELVAGRPTAESWSLPAGGPLPGPSLPRFSPGQPGPRTPMTTSDLPPGLEVAEATGARLGLAALRALLALHRLGGEAPLVRWQAALAQLPGNDASHDPPAEAPAGLASTAGALVEAQLVLRQRFDEREDRYRLAAPGFLALHGGLAQPGPASEDSSQHDDRLAFQLQVLTEQARLRRLGRPGAALEGPATDTLQLPAPLVARLPPTPSLPEGTVELAGGFVRLAAWLEAITPARLLAAELRRTRQELAELERRQARLGEQGELLHGPLAPRLLEHLDPAVAAALVRRVSIRTERGAGELLLDGPTLRRTVELPLRRARLAGRLHWLEQVQAETF